MDGTISDPAAGSVHYPAIDIDELKVGGNIFRENTGASIIDAGDRIALVEFHTKANSINGDVCRMLAEAVQDGAGRFDAVIVGNQGKHFSAGANLVLLLEQALAGRWSDIEQTIRLLQDTNMKLKYSSIPVVTAPFSSTLGGGCEICLHATRVVAAETLHMGLVETGVGLVPAGGGTKELGLRALAGVAGMDEAALTSALQKVFEQISTARVSRNGTEAKQLFLSAADQVVPGANSPTGMARQVAMELVQSGYRAGTPQQDVPVTGRSGIGLFQSTIEHMLASQAITEHDAVIAGHVARILCGGDGPAGTANEQHFLDLEREAFLSLLGTAKTQERIAFLLKNNKPLRN